MNQNIHSVVQTIGISTPCSDPTFDARRRFGCDRQTGRAGVSSVLLVVCCVIAVQTPLASAIAEPAESTPPQMAMPLMTSLPKIDGVIDEAEWKHATRHVGFASHSTRRLSTREGVFWLGCDGRTLYVAVKTEAPPDGRILTRAVPDEIRDQRAAFLDDSIELILDPKRERRTGDRKFYHIITNARGALYDWSIDPDNRQSPVDLGWRLRDWQLAQQLADGWWHVEIAIPLSSLGVDAKDLGSAWGIRVARNWKRPFEQSQWASEAGNYDQQATMPQVRCHQTAPVVRVLGLQNDGAGPQIGVALFNPHQQPMTVSAHLADAWHRDPQRRLHKQIELLPQQETVVTLECRDGGPEGHHNSLIQIASPDGEQVYHQRSFQWSPHKPKDRWVIGEEQKQAIGLQFKFYPYHRKVRFRASIEALAVRGRVTGAEAMILPTDDQDQPTADAVWRQPVAFRDDVAEGIHEIPELSDGKYVFALQLLGGDGVPDEPVTQPFVRQVFPWEHNTLGISDEVLPPFEPLTVDENDKNTVSAVLRRHVHGPSGLWNQVTSDGQPLLAGPMTWEVTARKNNGNTDILPVTGRGWHVVSAKPTALVGQSQWSAGPVEAKVTTEYDYDGMMLVTLALQPTTRPIERLSLRIPLRDAKARYMHAVGDGLRHNYAGFTPSGEGPIWNSGQASKLEILGTFYPYLWLGDGERGLCWFADTDRDWLLDDSTPTVELTRQGDTLAMLVHFVTRPSTLERPHRIVFGLQATPTKPMPAGWRRWTGLKQIEGGRPVRWMGANYYWGSLAYGVYPHKYRYDFFDKLKEARETGEPDRQFMTDWMAMVDKEIAAKDTDRYPFFLAHVNAGFHIARSSRWSDGFRLFGYTNARGVGFGVPEFATFQDEWLRYGWFNRNWGSGEAVGYDLSPSRSFQDYALWHYREMLRCFDGVYWDNMFLSAHFDPVVGEAWTDPKGRAHPTMGLMHLRDLAKRTTVMLWQETKGFPEHRKPPITLSHMTNTMIVPVHSFLNCTMDWEWKYGYEDFQDRFSPDLTVAQTIGRQVGAWPTILAGGHPDPKDPRVDFLWRTRLGVALVHEIQVFDYRPKRDFEIYGKLFEFGYGTDACQVFNYWHDNHPVAVTGADARTLAMTNGTEAIVVVTDYGDGGSCRVTLDLAKLGIASDTQATNLETGKTIDRDGPGVFVFDLKKHDFCILRVK